MCGTYDKEEVGIATGYNGIEAKVCKYCDICGSNYNGWGWEWGDDRDCNFSE